VRARGIFVSIATVGLMVGPAFAHGFLSSVAGARQECTITGTAADDQINGTTRDDVICGKAGQDDINGLEGNDVIRGGQGDDGGGEPVCTAPIHRRRPACAGLMYLPSFFGLQGGDGSDTIKGQQDDDSIQGQDQSDDMFGGNGDDCLGQQCAPSGNSEPGNDFLKTKDNVSGNDIANGGDNTDTCRIDAGDEAISCEL
jgi:Ca2+-binding RTX toxin-like protein